MSLGKRQLPSAGCGCACRPKPAQPATDAGESLWNTRYFLIIATLAAVWLLVYSRIEQAANRLVFDSLGFAPDSVLGAALEFFLYDTVKILLLLAALIYVIAWLRACLNVERTRDFLAGKRRGLGYFLGSAFGAVTPFCSCSSVPLFLGFTTARIPIGITMSFLITSPLINEIGVVLLWGLLGWKFTLIYVTIGMGAGIIGGFFMDGVRAERWLRPSLIEALSNVTPHQLAAETGQTQKLTVRQRHAFASGETVLIFKRVWMWVLIGVGVGAVLHGFVPQDWFAENLGAGEWWSVPAAVFAAIPLYSNVTGIVPIMESLLAKGLPLGTTLAFCMSAVAASLPEVMLLRQIMTIKLQAAFIGYLWVLFTLVGWLFNLLGPYL